MNTFNRIISLLTLGVILVFTSGDISKAQDVEVTTGVDFYSTYVFRGVAYDGPSWQPAVEVSSGGFAIGAWGSQGYTGFQEMDLYAGYSFDFGLYLGVTDYYYPGSLYLDGDSHAFEINAGFEQDAFSLAGNFIVNEAVNAGSAGGDLYFEAGYSLDQADLFVGAGDGWHSTDGEFALVNIGIGTSKDIVITDTFTIPVSGAVVFNPDSEQFYILVGLSF
ncbi:MAG: hypothetical protein JJ971_15110 [Balneolaceae bacterium]|nr:hypothetical protein [Balneolaceae bacterium]MBO6547728.1 hypothetical protein [Balneolaceae bacterium]MBO6648239.1 hypothetical protein [Balneolaceae bacterium]